MNQNNFPIKYIEDNLIWNHKGECFVYYEMIPYNYSCLSIEQKIQLRDTFRQLIAQNRSGCIHALQIAAEESIRSVQEKSKQLIKGKLKEKAVQIVDEQTDALISIVGDNQVNYRFFLGFKLVAENQVLNVKNLSQKLQMTIQQFIYEVNHELMGDFVNMNNAEIERMKRLERFLEERISKRFQFRRLDKNDIGYIVEHLYGQTGIPYEEYEYYLPKEKMTSSTVIKKYDILRLSRCCMKEKGRYVELIREKEKHYAAYFTIDAVVGELEFPSSEIFYYQQQHFDFPIDVSMNIEIVSNQSSLTTLRNKKKELKDLNDHAAFNSGETEEQVENALDDTDELINELNKSKESMYKLSYVVRVCADSVDELEGRCNAVRDYYDDFNIRLVRPFGDMLGLHREFLPASSRYINDYIQYVTVDFLSGLGFGATQMLGERYGIYIGYNIDTNRNVYINPSLVVQNVKGSVTNAPAMAFVGATGNGKSFADNLICYLAALFGAKMLFVDPKSERGNWKETLPDIADAISILNLTSEDKNKGLLDPFAIMQDVKAAESLAVDILTFLTGISSRDSERFPVLRRAVRVVAGYEKRGLLLVVDELRKEKNPIADGIAEHIASFTDYSFAQLLFSDGNVKNCISIDNQINIVQIADLVLPDCNASLEEYTVTEMLSVAMLIVISTFALEFIHGDRSVFKIVNLDEAWAFLRVQQGIVLSNKLVRAGRAMNAGVYFITQSAGDLLDEKTRNNIGVKFAFRSKEMREVQAALEFFGLDAQDEGNQKLINDLENGQCLMQDIYGRVGVIQIHPVFQYLLSAFDSRPPLQEEMVI